MHYQYRVILLTVLIVYYMYIVIVRYTNYLLKENLMLLWVYAKMFYLLLHSITIRTVMLSYPQFNITFG